MIDALTICSVKATDERVTHGQTVEKYLMIITNTKLKTSSKVTTNSNLVSVLIIETKIQSF